MSLKFFKIGNVNIEKSAALAPMASVADVVYRKLCKQFKASYVVSEMISVKGICFNEKAMEKYMKITQQERPMAIQLFGSDPYYFELALEKVLKFQPDIIDLNMGCPVRKVVRSGAGCKLMTNVKLAEKIVLAVVKHSIVPVTVKIRMGWDENSVNALEFSKRMEACGVSAITIHGRTRSQFYSGKSDWNFIAKVKQNLKIPVIASGDVFDAVLAEELYLKSGADLIMVGRGSFGKPWIFYEIYHYLKTGKLLKEPNFRFKMKVMLKHIKDLCCEYGENSGMKIARFHAINYFHNFENAAKFRMRCSKLKKFNDAVNLVNEVLCNIV